jgi:hypothetical protein
VGKLAGIFPMLPVSNWSFAGRKSDNWGPNMDGVLPNKKSALSLLHPDASAPSILRNELDGKLRFARRRSGAG